MEQKLKILFMGTPDFAVFSLRAMVEAGENVIGVITQPDQPKGRGYTLTPPPVKVFAEEKGIPVWQPERLRTEEFLTLLKDLAPDLCVVAAYGKILPQAVLDLPKYGCINLHGSLLPEYRGAAPMQRAIMDGKVETGITVMQMDAGLDTGDMILQGVVPIGEDDNFEVIHDRMGECGAELLLRVLEQLRDGELTKVPQDPARATYAAKIEKEECLLDFNDTSSKLHNKIRGLSPIPLAYTYTPDGKRVKIVASCVMKGEVSDAPAGTVLSLDGGTVRVSCGEGVLGILEVIPEGKGKMSAAAWINGRKIAVGDVFRKL